MNKFLPSRSRVRFTALFLVVSLAFSFNLPYGFISVHAAVPVVSGGSSLVDVSAGYSLPVLKGLRIDPQNPLHIQFFIDSGSQPAVSSIEASRLIKYFLAALTIPEQDLWVNLSPYEKDSIAPESLAATDLGGDLLAQDYFLKRLAASLTYPESGSGRDYWSRIYERLSCLTGNAKLPLNTFNKIWIAPDKAQVYEEKDLAFIIEARLKVMMESDYAALKSNRQPVPNNQGNIKNDSGFSDKGSGRFEQDVVCQAMKDAILPKICRDVNSGENFAQLRQMYYSMVLAVWFKNKFKESFYKYYIDKNKISGVNSSDMAAKDRIYQEYVKTFTKGVYDYVKKEADPSRGKVVARRYYSGGYAGEATSSAISPAFALDHPWNTYAEGSLFQCDTGFDLLSGSGVVAASPMTKDDFTAEVRKSPPPPREQVIAKMAEIIPPVLRTDVDADAAVLWDNSADAVRQEKQDPVTVVFRASELLKNYPGQERPRLLALTLDHDFLHLDGAADDFLDGSEIEPLDAIDAKGGERFMMMKTQDKLAEKIAGVKTKALVAEDIGLVVSMGFKIPLAKGLFNGGKGILVIFPREYKNRGEIVAHIKSILERLGRSSITGNFLLTHRTWGPDMSSAEFMGFVMEVSDRFQRELYARDPIKYSRFRIPIRATTSGPWTMGSYNHGELQATSRSVDSTMLPFLGNQRWLNRYPALPGADGLVPVSLHGAGEVSTGLIRLWFQPIVADSWQVTIRGRGYSIGTDANGDLKSLRQADTNALIDIASKIPGNIRICGHEFKVGRTADRKYLTFTPDFGYKIVAICDKNGAISNPEGLKPEKLLEYCDSFDRQGPDNSSIQNDFSGECRRVSKQEFFKLRARILIPASIPSIFYSRVVDGSNSNVLAAVNEGNAVFVEDLPEDLVLINEAGNDTLADQQVALELHKRGVFFVSGRQSNLGGVDASGQEYTDNALFGRDFVVTHIAQFQARVCNRIEAHAIVNANWLLRESLRTDFAESPVVLCDRLSRQISREVGNIFVKNIHTPNMDKFYAHIKSAFGANTKSARRIVAVDEAYRKVFYNHGSADDIRVKINEIVDKMVLESDDEFQAREAAIALANFDFSVFDENTPLCLRKEMIANYLLKLAGGSKLHYTVRCDIIDALGVIGREDKALGDVIVAELKRGLVSSRNSYVSAYAVLTVSEIQGHFPGNLEGNVAVSSAMSRPGGITMDGLNVGVSPDSIPVELEGFDPRTFEGIVFRILSILPAEF